MLQPDPFLTVRIHRPQLSVPLSGLCVGYERGTWRVDQLARHAMDWLPEFALTPSEGLAIGHQNATKLLRQAAERIYTTAKFSRRGEFGELFLHIAIRQVYNSLPAISKIFYKSALNDTVKGFDAVHVVGPPEDLELWLGEAKFYSDFAKAASEVRTGLQVHLQTDYLRDEFSLIVNKIDDAWPHASALRRLLQPEVSLDEVFKRVCIPVLITYDSQCVAGHTVCDAAYAQAFEAELLQHHQAFIAAGLPSIRIVLFLLPLLNKKDLAETLDEHLRRWQEL
jgi:hypothetical protein